jgi:pimeloyl-ACP methyl ester carboxylesterase
MSMSSSVHHLKCLGPHGFHRIGYRQWGTDGNPRQLVCVHGLTRNSHDFDRFADALSRDYRVSCPDVVGRGISEWLPVKTDYHYGTYTADMAALLGRLGAEQVDWVGTSMGGIIGMMLAGRPNSPIRKLVLNDIGAFVPKTLLDRILTYLGVQPDFASLKDAEVYLRDLYRGFGPLNDEQWVEVTAGSTYQTPEGRYALAYDPGIAEPWRAVEQQDASLWEFWDAIECPVLILRGAVSDALSAETAAEMTRRGPKDVTVVEIPQTGHNPPLMDPEQIEGVRRWLLED